jgi:hypothetical protein
MYKLLRFKITDPGRFSPKKFTTIVNYYAVND